MKVPINWLKELVELKVPVDEVVHLLPLRTIGTKEVTNDFFELDMKGYNRADLLSLRGTAYEIGAITNSPVIFKEISASELIWEGKNLPRTAVKVENSNLVPLYCIAKISNLKVTSSSQDWVKKLADSGMRTVNNIADITNLIMLEYGQPLHSFDASQVTDEALIVRVAKEDEKLITLDNKTRELLPTDLLITDPQKAVGLAGVMGGKNSEVTEQTTTILLEAAIFNPITLRKTVSRLNLSSEASKRFQHGLSPTKTLQALDAAIRMYQQLGGTLDAISIIGKTEEKLPLINVGLEKVNSLIGLDLTPDFIKKSLEKLHFEVTEKDGRWQVIPPYWRLDVNIEADVIEEVARMYGYENIPAKPLTGEIPAKVNRQFFNLIQKIRETLVNLGLTELQTYSYYSTQILENYQINRESLIKILNPMSKETEYLRTYISPNLVEKTAENLKFINDVAIFEIGKSYQITDGLPEEKHKLAISLSNNSGNPVEELYAICQKLIISLNLQIEVKGSELDEKEGELFHPTRFLKVTLNGQVIGAIGEVHPRIINRFGVEKRVAILEINLDQLKP